MEAQRGRFEAVVFDLYGTLVPEFAREDFRARLARTAGVLGVPADAFLAAWEETSLDRQTGRIPTIEHNLREICSRLGCAPSAKAIADALEIRAAMYAEYFRPVPGAIETLRWLKARRYPTGLISMCAPDTPPLWRASPLAPYLDVLVFSSEVGLRKPDPEIYRYATDRLRARPERSLFVGDGAYGELSGAEAVGMEAVLIRDPREGPGAVHRPEVDDWDGPRIARISEVRDLVEAGPRRSA